jgi:hypothetical protein
MGGGRHIKQWDRLEASKSVIGWNRALLRKEHRGASKKRRSDKNERYEVMAVE